ncbi:MAG TPA: DNA polymerase III subunit beta [Polyangiaceae bacterium]|nr:DNA polymerase III subunit beta [Polyangiaceae bacterium]
MHVIVSKKDLVPVLERCQGVADRKSTMPVLGNVLLEVGGPNELKLAATDLILAVRGKVNARVEQGGTVAVGARDLVERVRNMPDGEIGIATTANAATTLRAVGSARRFTLQGIPGEEFPSLPQPDKDAKAQTLEASVLSTLIAGTHFSISNDETRPHLSSALFEWDGEWVRMVTTDGHRLSKVEARIEGRHGTGNMLIPLKGVNELRRLCDEASSKGDAAELKIVQSGPNAFFELPGFQFSVKLVDAQFPPYQQVIPQEYAQRVKVPRSATADALNAVSVAASDRTGGVKLSLSKGKLRFESESPESGEGFDELSVDYAGGDLTVGFNARYFLDVLRAITDDEVEIGVSGELDPAVVRPATPNPKVNYVAVIMPMRI